MWLLRAANRVSPPELEVFPFFDYASPGASHAARSMGEWTCTLFKEILDTIEEFLVIILLLVSYLMPV